MERACSPHPAGNLRGNMKHGGDAQLDAERELLRVTEACGALPVSLVPRLEAQTGGQGILQRALGAGYVSLSDVPTYRGDSLWFLTITRQERDRLRGDPRSREWASLDGWQRKTTARDPPKGLSTYLLRAQAFASVLLLVRAAGAEPQSMEDNPTPMQVGETRFYSAGLCRRLLRDTRPELRRMGRCLGGVVVRDGSAWVINLVLRDGLPWSAKEEETKAAAFVGLVRCLGAEIQTVNLLYVGQHFSDILLLRPPGAKRSRQQQSWYGSFQRVCFVDAGPNGATVLRELLDPVGRQVSRARWIPDAEPPDFAHAMYDGITSGRPILLAHTCDLPVLHKIAQWPRRPLPILLCLPGRGRPWSGWSTGAGRYWRCRQNEKTHMDRPSHRRSAAGLFIRCGLRCRPDRRRGPVEGEPHGDPNPAGTHARCASDTLNVK